MNIQDYSLACITSLESSKNPSAIAREIHVDQSMTSRFLQKLQIEPINIVPMVRKLFGNKSLILVLDDFVATRRYSQETEGVSSMIDQSIKAFTNGIKIVAVGVTDGTYFLPLDLEQWIAQFIAGDAYLKTTDVAQKLVDRMRSLELNISHCVFDGLYFSFDFMQFLDGTNQKFVIKAKTTTSVIYQGKKMQLRNCPDLRLNSNQNQKKIIAEWNGRKWYFIAVRRHGKRGEKIIYLIANFKAKTKVYARIYRIRWPIEKFIRTGKQSLGLKDSQAQEARVYLSHMRCVFFAYCITQFIMKKYRLDSAEEAIRKAQALKRQREFNKINDWVSLLVPYA